MWAEMHHFCLKRIFHKNDNFARLLPPYISPFTKIIDLISRDTYQIWLLILVKLAWMKFELIISGWIEANPFSTNVPFTDNFNQQNVWKTPVEEWHFK